MREKEPSTRIIYVRHGNTDFPIDRIYCDDREDPPLNARGIAQADAAAQLLKGVTIDALYSSPCARTLATAQVIEKHHAVTIRARDALRERHFGIWEGLYFHEIAERFPEEQRRWKQDNAGFKPQGGESIADLLARLNNILTEIFAEYAGKTVVIVTHVGPIRALVADAIGLPMAEYRRLSIDNASLTRVDYGQRQNNLIYLNSAQGVIA